MRLTPPETQDTHVFDITLNLFTYPAVLIAHKLGLFETLNQPGEWSVLIKQPSWACATGNEYAA